MRRKAFFIEKGYDIEKLKKQVETLPERTFTNKDYTKIMIDIKVEELLPTAETVVEVKCDYCEDIFETSYLVFNTYEGKHTCPKCVPLKRKETNLKNYGVENPSQREEIKKKKEQKSLEKYGMSNVLKSKEIQEKVAETNLKKYGVKNPQQNPDIQAKTKMTNLEKYGAMNPNQNEEVKQKTKKTNQKKYDSISFVGGITWRKHKYDSMIYYFDNLGYNIISLLEEFCNQDISEGYELSLQCKSCSNKFNKYFSRAFVYDKSNVRCPYCLHNHSNSLQEDELFQYIRAIYSGEIIRNIRSVLPSGKEIDIYIPDLKIGIEYNGLTWHSEIFGKKNFSYHLNKLEEAHSVGVDLLFIYDNEWVQKKDIVKSILNNKLGVNTKKIYGRNCEIKLVAPDKAFFFINENHIQGAEVVYKNGVSLGLFYEEELVALISFGKPRFIHSYDWELLRFCNKLGVSVIGGFAKLLKFFEKEYKPKSLLTYSEKRLFSSGVYLQNGFKQLRDSKPMYFYIKNGKYIGTQYKFRRKNLPKLLDSFDPSLTEWQNMINNGYDRVWDCGHRVFVKEYEQNREDVKTKDL